MNINNLLNQVLGAGQQYSQNNTNSGNLGGALQSMLGGNSAGGIGGMLQNVLAGATGGNRGGIGALGALLQNSNQLKGVGAGAAAAGVLSMLMGGGTRGLGGSLAKMGSMAAIGTLAYKAYQSWQHNNAGSSVMNNPHAGNAPQISTMQPTTERGEDEAEQNSRVILTAMIAAAKADGEISAEEQGAILNQVGSEDAETQEWLQQLVQNTPSVAQIATMVGNDQGLAAEVYLASRIVCGDLDRSEMVYLVNLQQALGLHDSFVEMLEKQIQ